MGVLGDLNSVGSLYQLYRQVYGQNAGDEAGSSRPIMSEAQFAALPESQQFAMAGEAQQTNMFSDGQGNVVGYGDGPNWLGMGADSFVNDPSKIQRTDGRFSVGMDNLNEDALFDRKNESDRSGYFGGTPLQNIVRGFGTVLGAAYAANAAGLGEGGALAGNSTPAAGYMGDPYTLDPGFFDAAGNAVGGGAGAGAGAVPEGFNAADWWTGDPSGATGPLGGSAPVDVPIIPEGVYGPEYSPEADWWTGDPTGNTGPLGPGGTPVDVPVIPGNASESWWERLLNNATDKLPDLARDLLGGGQQGGGNPVIAALMGATGKLGDHRQDNDPYGLQASGYGPWKGLLDDPKAKVVDAMMKRKQDSIWS